MEDGSRLNDCNFLTVDNSDAVEGEVVPVNADTLGGHKAEDFVKKDDAMVVTKNYCVVGGMEEPENKTENMIWVQTEELGDVHISSAEPLNVKDNDIWICTGTGSIVAFDAVRIGNDTMNTIYPLRVEQYVDGVWKYMNAKSWQEGAWTQFSYDRLYIFKAGEGAVVALSAYKESSAKITVGTDSIEITYSDKDQNYITSTRTTEKLPMSSFNYLCMEYIAGTRLNSKYAYIGVTPTEFKTGDPTDGITWEAKTAITKSTKLNTVRVSLENVSPELYPAVYFGGQMSIYNIWLE